MNRIYLEERSVNLRMVEQGWAWQFKRYSQSVVLAKAESSSRKEFRGIWSAITE